MSIDMMRTCGGMPVQYEGTVDGFPAYFRLRFGYLYFAITKLGTDPIMPNEADTLHYYEQQFDDQWLGDMEDVEARGIMEREAKAFRISQSL